MCSRFAAKEDRSFDDVGSLPIPRILRSDDLKTVTDKEFYSVLALVVAGIAVIALTIGPFSII